MNKYQLKNAILVTGFFSTGIMIGFLLSSRNGRNTRLWISNNSRKIMRHGKETVHRFSEHFKESLDNTLPNLYDATEEIIIDDFGRGHA